MLRFCFLLGGCCLFGFRAVEQESALLAKWLRWRSGQSVADFGAGKGELATKACEILGSDGVVYAVEANESKLQRLRRLQKSRPCLHVVASTDTEIRLPFSCCDSIYLRGVYHHLTQPAHINQQIYRALKPKGRLAVIDFYPSKLLTWFVPVRGVPSNRGGHGVPASVVEQELREAGFQIEQRLDDWPKGHYCIVARRGS